MIDDNEIKFFSNQIQHNFHRCNICGEILELNIRNCPVCRSTEFSYITLDKLDKLDKKAIPFCKFNEYYTCTFPARKLSTAKDKLEELEEREKLRKNRIKHKEIIFSISLIILTILMLGLAIFSFINKNMQLGIVLLIVSVITFLIPLFLLLMRNTAQNDNNTFKNEIEILTNFINIYPAFERNINKLVVDRANGVSAIIQNCNTLFAVLKHQYSPLLDTRDWQHIDLIIYYLETRRADSIKEALQLVDREIHTQRIENAIQLATAQICNTLAIGFTVLQQTIDNGFNMISRQIAVSTTAISSQLSQLTGAINMNNALRAKANVSSEQLMKDINDLRNYIIK